MFDPCMYRIHGHLHFFCNKYFYLASNAEKVSRDYKTTWMYPYGLDVIEKHHHVHFSSFKEILSIMG